MASPLPRCHGSHSYSLTAWSHPHLSAQIFSPDVALGAALAPPLPLPAAGEGQTTLTGALSGPSFLMDCNENKCMSQWIAMRTNVTQMSHKCMYCASWAPCAVDISGMHHLSGGVLLERWTLQHSSSRQPSQQQSGGGSRPPSHSASPSSASASGRSYVDDSSIYKRMVGTSGPSVVGSSVDQVWRDKCGPSSMCWEGTAGIPNFISVPLT